MATPPTSQYFLPDALAQAGILLPVGENTAVPASTGETASNSLSHGSTLGTTAFASSNELGHDKGASRVRLTDQEKLLLVRLCVLHGEEYLGPKEVFWTKRTAEISEKTRKRIGNARTIVILNSSCIFFDGW